MEKKEYIDKNDFNLYLILKEIRGRGSTNRFKGVKVNINDCVLGWQIRRLGYEIEKTVRDKYVRPIEVNDGVKTPIVLSEFQKEVVGIVAKEKCEKKDDTIKTTSFWVDNRLYETVLHNGLPVFAFLNDGDIHYESQVGMYAPQFGEEVNRGIVMLPIELTPVNDVGALIADIEVFINKYCDLPKSFTKVAAYYVLLTYFYDRLEQIPYLSFLGDTGTGKSRCKFVIGSVCYLPILTSGGTSPAAFYRLIDKWKGTLLIDEADLGKSDESQEIIKLLNCGYEKHSPRVVCDKENPDKLVFNNAYCPKIISRRFAFYDKAVESRCITQVTQQTIRKDILVVLPPSFFKEATDLRNKLSWLRLKHWFDYENPKENILAGLDIEPRLQQAYTSLALVLSAFPQEIEKFKVFLVEKNAEIINERANTIEGFIVAAFCALQNDGVEPITAKVIYERVKEEVGEEIKSPRSLSSKLKALGFVSELKKVSEKGTHRVVKIPTELLTLLQKRFGVGNEGNEGNAVTVLNQNIINIKKSELVTDFVSNIVSLPSLPSLPKKKEGSTNLTGIMPTGEKQIILTFDEQIKDNAIMPNKVSLITPESVMTQLLTSTPRSFADIQAPFELLGIPEAETMRIITYLKGQGSIIETSPDKYLKVQ